MDIAHDALFDTYLNQQDDLPIVEGRAAFEQEVVDRLTDYLQQVIGSIDRDGAIRLIELQARRVAEDTDEIDELVLFDAAYNADRPNTVDLRLIYETGDDVTFSLTV